MMTRRGREINQNRYVCFRTHLRRIFKDIFHVHAWASQEQHRAGTWRIMYPIKRPPPPASRQCAGTSNDRRGTSASAGGARRAGEVSANGGGIVRASAAAPAASACRDIVPSRYYIAALPSCLSHEGSSAWQRIKHQLASERSLASISLRGGVARIFPLRTHILRHARIYAAAHQRAGAAIDGIFGIG